MDDLTEFLRARLDEDAADLNRHKASCQMMQPVPAGFPYATFSCNCGGPDRAERDVEAKRRIVELHEPDASEYLPHETPFCAVCMDTTEEFKEDWTGFPWPCPTVRCLASAYSDHPDYREEWRP